METKKKILFFILTTLILGTITFLVIRNTQNKESVEQEPVEETPTITEAIVENIKYEKYLDLRSKAHETETYAIVIWNSDEEVSVNFIEEVKVAFQNRKSTVYLLDTKGMKKEDYSRVIDDVSSIMKYKKPTLIVPTIITMSKGDIVYKHAGFIYKEELMDNLNAKSIE